MSVEKELINDDRLTPTMKRSRSGSTQYFKEDREGDREPTSRNPDFTLEHPTDVAMYAELIDEKWYWVTGCAECKGESRDMMSYVECDVHNICSICSIKRKDVKEKSVWGGLYGWTCNPCHDARDKEVRKEAFEKLDGEEPDCFYTDEPICPHCGTELGSDDMNESQAVECYVCKGQVEVEVEYSRSFTTRIKGKRIRK